MSKNSERRFQTLFRTLARQMVIDTIYRVHHNRLSPVNRL